MHIDKLSVDTDVNIFQFAGMRFCQGVRQNTFFRRRDLTVLKAPVTAYTRTTVFT